MMTTTGLGDVQQSVDDDGNRGPCLRRTETRQLRAASEDTASLLSSTSSSAGSSRPWSDDDSPHEDEREHRRGTPRGFTPGSSRASTPSMAKKGSLKKVEHSTMAGKENAAGSVNTSQAKDAGDATKWTSNVEKWQRDDGTTTALSPRKNKRKSKKQTADENSPQSERQILRPLAASGAQPRNGKSKYQIPQPVEEPDLENGELCAIEMELLSEASPTPLAKLKPSTSVRSSAIRMMERLPLLHRQSSIENDPEWGFKNAIESRPDLAVEFKSLCELSYPVIFTYVLEFLPGIVSMTLVGHMDSPKTKEYVDGVSLSTMFMNLTGVAFGFGLATAMDTLCSQAYGAGKPMKMGIYFQCGILVLGFTVIPVFLLNWFTDRFLLWMGQPAEVAMLAGRFSRLILPGIPFLYVYELFKKLLQAQNVVKPMVYIAILSNVVNIVLGVYLTWYTSLGYDGAAIARTISNVVLPTALIPYFMMHPEVVRQWWPGWKLSQAIQHLKAFLTLGIPGMFMMLLEWWSFEIMAAFVGWLPDSVVALSVHSVLTNISTLTFNFFLGIAVATNIRVGNYVGSNQPDHAKLASALGMGLSLLVSTALAVVVVSTRYLLPVVFINDPTSVSLAGHALLFLMPYQMFDAINSVMQGVFRGTGRQSLAAYINLFGYFAIGLPFGVYLAFNLDFGVEGLWLGLTGGIAAGALISFIKIWRTNWDEMTDAARVRTS